MERTPIIMQPYDVVNRGCNYLPKYLMKYFPPSIPELYRKFI